MKPSILIVDYEPVDIEQIQKVTQELGFEFTLVNNGKDALKELENGFYNVLLADADLSDIPTLELIDRVDKLYGIVPIIMSDDSDPERIISSLGKYRVFDYVLKPIQKEVLKASIDGAVARYEYNLRVSSFTESEKNFYTTIIDIFSWKKELQQSQIESLTGNMIKQMNKNLFQDSGFAILFNTLNMFFSKAKFNAQKNSYEITRNLYNLIKDNFAQADKMVRTIAESQKILTREDPITETNYISEFVHILSECNTEIRPMAALKNQQVSLGKVPEIGKQKKIIFHRPYLKSVVKELLINAMKYSAERDLIIVLFFINNDHLELKVLNPARSNQEGKIGINEEDAKVVFEPFFRLTEEVDDRYTEEEFGYGLGLTIVKKIIELHGASLLVHTIRNNVNQSSDSEVVFSLNFPIIQ
ncbi:MAG: response regulator [Leptospiraceae bacterium]|nr:response regulator [Leptospiraceae bacterium]MCP5500106.1 response regulator [Leptospiraceae bacterium]